MKTITYKNKEYKIPFDLNLGLDKDKMLEVSNRFSGEKVSLPSFAVAVYDLIIGAELFSDYKTMQQGLSWFRRYFPKEYMVILDWCKFN